MAERSVFDELDEKYGYKPLSVPEQPGMLASGLQTADDVVRAAADAITFGGLDWMLGPEERKKTEEARRRSPYATLAGDVAGVGLSAVAMPWTLGTRVAQGLGAASTGLGGIRSALTTRAGLQNVGAKAAGFGVEGAAQGALQAAGHTDRLEDLAGNVGEGAATGGVLGSVLSPFARVASRPRAAVPSEEELAALGRAGKTELTRRSMDVREPTYNPQAWWQRADDLEQQLVADRMVREKSQHAPTFAALDYARRGRPHPSSPASTVQVTPSDTEVVRELLSGNTSASAQRVREAIDDFTRNPPHGAVLGNRGRAVDTARMVEEARGNIAAGKRSQELSDPVRAATLQAGATHSGLNFENALRQRIARILMDKDAIRGLSDTEKKLLERLSTRADDKNIMRYLTNIYGAGGGLGALLGGSAAGLAGYGASSADPIATGISGLVGLGAPLAGRMYLNRSLRRDAGALAERMRMRSPEFEKRFAANPRMTPVPPYPRSAEATRRALTNEILRQQMMEER